MENVGYINQNHELVPFRIAFTTLGCKVNRYETDSVQQAFESLGFQIVNADQEADVYIVNTCTVTAEADRKSGQMIRRAGRLRKDAIVASMGCRTEILKKQNENTIADINVGTSDRMDIVQKITDCLKEKYGASYFSDSKSQSAVLPANTEPVVSQEESRAYIKIEDGCDLFCSYCIIPYARGKVKSRPEAEIIKEAQALANKGFREIVLTGIHLCSYGKDINRGIDYLAELLENIAKIDGIKRIRLGSLEPKSITEEFISRISRIDKLCAHFHMSLQSGSKSVLERMNRQYNPEDYEKTIHLLRTYFPDCGLTTDIIVAFPGESDTEHKESLSFCEKIAFSGIHVFPYSERKGTRAAKILPKISSQISEKRKHEFLLLAKQLKENFSEKWIGKICEVIIEEKPDQYGYSGYSREYIRTHLGRDQIISPKEPCNIKIEKALSGELYGVALL